MTINADRSHFPDELPSDNDSKALLYIDSFFLIQNEVLFMYLDIENMLASIENVNTATWLRQVKPQQAWLGDDLGT